MGRNNMLLNRDNLEPIHFGKEDVLKLSTPGESLQAPKSISDLKANVDKDISWATYINSPHDPQNVFLDFHNLPVETRPHY